MLKIQLFNLKVHSSLFCTIDELQIHESECAFIIGPNRSGKSLLLQSIFGSFKDYQGSIFLKDTLLQPHKQNQHILLIQNQNDFLWNNTIWENLVLPFPKISPRQKTKIQEYATLCGLKDIETKPVSELSYSDLKFIELIRTVIQLPYLILIDDMDMYWDQNQLTTAWLLIEFALKGGTAILATGKSRINGNCTFYEIQNNLLEKA